jgi:hypothetical protein
MRVLLAIIIGVGGLAAPARAETARFLVCPPELNYCYREDKPIRPQMDQADQERQIIQMRYDMAKYNCRVLEMPKECQAAIDILRDGTSSR